MTNGSTHTPPPPPPGGGSTYTPGTAPKKKGLPPLAWVGIGCGVLLLIGGIAFALLVGWGFKKAGDVARDLEDPGRASMLVAKGIVAANPELELVEADDEAGTLTIRNTQTGEVMTVDVSEVKEGRFSFTGEDGEEVTMGMEEGEDGQGAFTVRDREGNETFRVGSGGEENVPSWVPRYEGVTIEGTMMNRTSEETTGAFSFETEDSVDEVLAHYKEALEEEGLTLTGESDNRAGDGRFANLTFEADGRTVNVMVTTDGGLTNTVVTYSEPNR